MGMHRSGTSAVARVLSLLGAALPRQLMAPDAAQNPTGFWEPNGVVELNDRLLRELGSRWDDMLSARLGADERLLKPETVRAAVEVLDQEFGDGETIVLKDPRLSVLAPLWMRALQKTGREPAVVIVVRNPVEVAQSLARRNGFPTAKSLLMWTSYMIAAERDTRGFPRLAVHYPDLLADWRGTLDVLRTRFPWVGPPSAKAEQEIGQFLNAELRTHWASDEELESDPAVWSGVVAVSRAFNKWRGESLGGPLQAIEAQLLTAGRVLGQYLVGREMDLQDALLELASYKSGRAAPPGLNAASQSPESSENSEESHAVPASGEDELTRWWQSPAIVRHINRTICGKPVPGTDGGDIELLRSLSCGRPYARAAASNCGGGAHHELRLVQAGVVTQLDIYEPDAERAGTLSQTVRRLELAHRVKVIVSDPAASGGDYDLVYWKDNLHLLQDLEPWTEWSWDVLGDQGLFFMNGFLRSGYRYSRRQLQLADQARTALPERYLLTAQGRAPSLQHAGADSPEPGTPPLITDLVAARFSDLTLIPTGGVIYGLALSDILSNFADTCGQALLRTLLLADDLCAQAGESLYAVAYGRKVEGANPKTRRSRGPSRQAGAAGFGSH
jgi:hypothetical protein